MKNGSPAEMFPIDTPHHVVKIKKTAPKLGSKLPKIHHTEDNW
jgi:hypothetical protein